MYNSDILLTLLAFSLCRYIGIGDQLLLRFDARTNRFPLNTEELVDRALRLEPPAFTGQAKFTGVWLNHTAAELTVTWVSPTFDNVTLQLCRDARHAVP